MARKRKFTETMLLKLPEETFADIQDVLGDTEDRVELVKMAIAREIA